jgi:hypothetical protein
MYAEMALPVVPIADKDAFRKTLNKSHKRSGEGFEKKKNAYRKGAEKLEEVSCIKSLFTNKICLLTAR